MDCLTFEDETDGLSRNVCNFQSKLRDIPEKRSWQFPFFIPLRVSICLKLASNWRNVAFCGTDLMTCVREVQPQLGGECPVFLTQTYSSTVPLTGHTVPSRSLSIHYSLSASRSTCTVWSNDSRCVQCKQLNVQSSVTRYTVKCCEELQNSRGTACSVSR